MRKLMSIAAALLLVTFMACPVFALDSKTDPVITTATSDGKEVPVTETNISREEPYADDASIVKAAGLTTTSNVSVPYLKDITVPAGVESVTITFTVPGADANDKVYVMHYNGTAWEVVAEGTGSSITATFKSLSPVAIVLEVVDAPTTGTGTQASPQTGANLSSMYGSAAIVVMAGAVAMLAKKHVKE